MQISEQFNYVELFLTFRCNFDCDYCINGNIERKVKELNSDQWAKAINSYDWKMPVTLGGGEPTLHEEFYELLDKIKPEVNIELLTNLTFDPIEFIKKVKPSRFTKKENAYKSIRASYHPAKHNPITLVNNAKVLQDNGFKVGLFGLNHPDNMKANMEMAELSRINGIYFFIKDYLGEKEGHKFGFLKYPYAVDGKSKIALCRTKNIQIGPDGNIYKCHRDLYKGRHTLGNIIDTPQIKQRFRKCITYGQCNPCDVKLRTNRFLDTGDCNVEIVPQTSKEIKNKMKILGRKP